MSTGEDKLPSEKLCDILRIDSDFSFLNRKVDPVWKDSCCSQHQCFLIHYLLNGCLTELVEPGQRSRSRLIDLTNGVRRISSIVVFVFILICYVMIVISVRRDCFTPREYNF